MSDSRLRMRRQKQETGAQCQQHADKRRHSVQGSGGEGVGREDKGGEMWHDGTTVDMLFMSVFTLH